MSLIMESETLASIEHLKGCKSKASLLRNFSKVIKGFGFSYYCLGTYLYTGKIYPQQTGVLQLPSEWENWYFNQDFNNVDPVVMLGKQVSMPFVWEDIPKLMKISDEQKAFLKKARSFGKKHTSIYFI